MRRLVTIALVGASLILPATAFSSPAAAWGQRLGNHHIIVLAPRAAPRAIWNRHNRSWWRGRPEWRGYAGRREGFSFAPGYGYYRIEPRLRGRHWRRGEYLPEVYRHHFVSDWAWFGVRSPPRGYAWVWSGDQIVLVSLGSGLILDVVSDVY
jgi:Ni/Co efflux regulator RcnB